MTPAQKAGLVIGQKYEITGGDEDHCFSIGDIVEFVHDDGSSVPQFSNGDDENYVGIKYVKAVEKQTPAQSAGLVIGQQYVLKRGTSSYGAGHVFTFMYDDSSRSVRFDCPISYDHDGWCYLYVADVESYVAKEILPILQVANKPSQWSVNVANGTTTLVFNKELTADVICDIIQKAGI